MFLKKYKPTTSGVRHKKVLSKYTLNCFKLKNLSTVFKKNSGRNNSGSVILKTKTYYRKNRYVIINSMRKNIKKVGLLCSILYQKNNSTLVGLVKYANGSVNYINLIHGMSVGQHIFNVIFPIRFYACYYPGCLILIKFLPSNAIFSNVILQNCKISKYVKAAGTYTRVFQFFKEIGCVSLKLPTGSVRYIGIETFVIVGRNSNVLNKKQICGKAGFRRNEGCKPCVRGVAMNPVDHPHGGRTKTSQPELSPWGWVTKKNK